MNLLSFVGFLAPFPRMTRRFSLVAFAIVACSLSLPVHAADEATSGIKTKPKDDADLLRIEGTVVDENDAPVPKTRVRLHTYAIKDSVPTTLADDEGRFHFTVDLATTRYITFVADNLKNGKRAYKVVNEEGTLGLSVPLKLVLKPPRTIEVEVRDPDGKAVADAYVEAGAMVTALAYDRSEPDGIVRLKVPADAKIDAVLAMKSSRGFDYWTVRPQLDAAVEACPEKLSLTLNGARRVRLNAVDSAGQPIQGVWVTPWTVMKPAKPFYVNLSGGFMSPLVDTKTDAKGVATIDWIPVDVIQHTTFLMRSNDFHLPQPPSLTPDMKDDVELTMTLLRTTRLSGVVLAEDGAPAVGIVVQAEGRGSTNHYYRNVARTNTQGQFEFKAYPNQAYLVAVLDETRAAPSLKLPELVEGEPVEDLQLRLGSGTVVRGIITDATGKIRPNATVTLIQTGQAPGAKPNNLSLVRWAHTDNEGRYQFRVGSGTFDLMDPGHKQRVSLTIDAEEEVVRNFSSN